MTKKMTVTEELNAAIAAAKKKAAEREAAEKKAEKALEAEKATAKKCADVIAKAKAKAAKAQEKADVATGGAMLEGARAYAAAIKGGVVEKSLRKHLNTFLDTKNDGAMRTWLYRVTLAYGVLELVPEGGASYRVLEAMASAKKAGMNAENIRKHAAAGEVEALKAFKTGGNDSKPAAPAPKREANKPAADTSARAAALFEKVKAHVNDAAALEALRELAELAGMPSITA